MKQKLISIAMAIAVGCGIAGGVVAADHKDMSKAAYRAARDRIDARYQADKKACGALKANARDICQAEAKGRQKVGKAELESQYEPSAEADLKAKNAKADADYDVAKEKCDDRKADARDACVQDAKAVKEAEVRLAKIEKVESNRAQHSRAAARERKVNKT